LLGFSISKLGNARRIDNQFYEKIVKERQIVILPIPLKHNTKEAFWSKG